MKTMKVQEIRKLAAEEIRTKIADSREEMMKLRFQQVTGQLTDTSHLRVLRRNIARMETILRQSGAEHAAVEGAK
jgi:large subunit ribosomal protein L29